MNEITLWMKEASHLDNGFVQGSLFGGIAWAGASLFSISKTNAVIVTVLAYAINQKVTSLIGKWIEPYHEMALVPLSGQIINLSVSLGSANLICHLVDKSLAISEIALLGAFLLVAAAIIQIALEHFDSFNP